MKIGHFTILTLTPITRFFSLLIFCIFTNGLFSQSTTNIHFQIIDRSANQLTAARLTVLQNGKPARPIIASRLHIAARENIVYTASGTASFGLAPGEYEFWFSKGMEYTVDVQQVKVEEGQEYFLSAYLERAIDTEGFVCGDMHLHTLTNSGHGDSNLEERVISCAAEGLEWAVATDHNHVTDYLPYLKKTGLEGTIKTTAGNEVSTSIGHFNIFPLEADAQPVKTNFKDAQSMFRNIRKESGEDVLIQVNHPREVAPFFTFKGLDPFFGTVNHTEWSYDFDAFEVLNANSQTGWIASPRNSHSVVRDWFNLLNRDVRVAGLGNSDSHSVINIFAGIPRNYIVSSTDVAADIDEDELATHIKDFKVIVACGLFPQLMVDGKNAVGNTYPAKAEKVSLQLKVQAAPWVDCTRAELVRNGTVVQTFNIDPGNKTAVRLDTTVHLQPQEDSWYVLMAHGDKDMYPVVGKPGERSYPSGFTNPVWIKVSDEKRYQPLFEQAQEHTHQNAHDTQRMLWIVREMPEFLPAVLYHLFHEEHENTLDIAEALLEEIEGENRIMLFRELAKTRLPGAQALMEKWLQKDLSPYEKTYLGSFTYFPIRKTENGQTGTLHSSLLESRLNFLETQFSYIYSGGVVQKAESGFWKKNKLPKIWTEVVADKNARFHFPAEEEGSHFLKTNWRMIKDTTLPFYISSGTDVQIWINGTKKQTVNASSNRSLADEIIEFPLKKGNNEIVLQLSAEKEASITFHHANKEWLIDPALILEEVNHLALNAPVEYLTEYHHRYHGHGVALTDGYRGSTNYSSQLWQGWFGEPAEVELDLGAKKNFQRISIGLLSAQTVWIFFPQKIEYLISADGKNYKSIFEKTFDAPQKIDPSEIMTFSQTLEPQQARYLKVVVTPIDGLPDWHRSKGEKAWVFLDEIIVE